MYKKKGNKYILYSSDGKKKLGEFSSLKALKEREQQIVYFKNKKKK